MAKKSGQKKNAESKQPSRTKRAAQVGVGALVLGAITWLTGGFTLENAFEWAKSLAIAFGVALIIRWTLAEPFKIPSGSMRPTLEVGDRIFVNKFVYGLRFPLNHCGIPFTKLRIDYASRRIWNGWEPQRWDIVVFKAVEDNAQHATLVKRVVGLPGERIHIEDGKVYANGEPLELPPGMPPVTYTASVGLYGVDESDKYAVVPENCYLLLGDNSAQSRDGRAWGWVPGEHILGRVSSIWWPIGRCRDFTGFSKTLWWRAVTCFTLVLVVVRLFLGRSWRIHESVAVWGLRDRDHIYISRWPFGLPIPFLGGRFYRGRHPKRGELVVYATPDDSQVLIGRAAALPGEEIRLDSETGHVIIDGQPLDSPECLARVSFDAAKGPYGKGQSRQYCAVPENFFFILSDNENVPDSRALGWVAHEHLIGLVSAVWWPPSRWRRIR